MTLRIWTVDSVLVSGHSNRGWLVFAGGGRGGVCDRVGYLDLVACILHLIVVYRIAPIRREVFM